MKHPILGQKNLTFYISAWIVISIIHVLFLRFSQSVDLLWAFIDSLVFNLLYAALALNFWYMCKSISTENLKILKLIENHGAAAAFSSLIWLGLSYALLMNIFPVEENYRFFLRGSLVWRIVIGVLFYFLSVSFYYVYIYSVNFKEQLIKEAELKTLVKEAELKSLKFQINPHFIFNSLNSINSLTMSDPQKAGAMTIKLSDYLRFTLSKNEKQKSKLKEEIDSTKLYLDIEKVRFGDKIEYVEEIQDKCLDVQVPSMILQPLFENAIKHGVYESLEKVGIKFSCSLNGDYLKVVVENEFDAEASIQKGEGIGLRNIRERLEKIYSKGNLLKVEKESNVFRVKLFIPIAEK
ncbi:histidine kinase [candidate division KSB1 bacterium]|nr:histidine kinase [candidate division KSB1 bacterium]